MMRVESYKYPVKEFRVDWIEERYPRVNPNQDIVKRISTRFAVGSQMSTDSETKTEVIDCGEYPASIVDHLKYALTQWQPSLDFGWLSPKMQRKTVSREFVTNTSFVNIIPVPSECSGYRGNEIVYQRVTGQKIPLSIDPVDWLESEPPTRKDLINAREEFLKARDAARLMNFWG